MKNIMTSDMDSEYAQDKKSPTKTTRKGTLLGKGRAQKSFHEHASGGHDVDARRSSMMSLDSADRKAEIEAELEELRNMIHPNEWNNIPACIRNAVMGLIDFNDKITQRIMNENTILQSKISGIDMRDVKNQSSIKF